jgi:hypothetical protein
MFKSSGRSFIVLLIIILSLLVVNVMADWPQFQGPKRDGHAVDQGIAKSWPKEGPKELWAVPLGEGFAPDRPLLRAKSISLIVLTVSVMCCAV